MTFKLLDLGPKTCYVYIIIYLQTVGSNATFVAITAAGIRQYDFRRVVKYSPIYLATYAKDLNNQQTNYF